MKHLLFNIRSAGDSLIGVVRWGEVDAQKILSYVEIAKAAKRSGGNVAEVGFFDDFDLYDADFYTIEHCLQGMSEDGWDARGWVLVDARPDLRIKLRVDVTRLYVDADGYFWWEILERDASSGIETCSIRVGSQPELFDFKEKVL